MKEQILKLIKAQDLGEEFYSSEYPDHKEAFLEFLKGNDIEIDPSEVHEQPSNLCIDADGYPCFDSTLNIPSIQLSVVVQACHHKEWNFYFKKEE